MRTKRGKIKGQSYRKRVSDINRIYEEHMRSGLSNREILRRYIQPIYPISESTMYNILKAEYKFEANPVDEQLPSLFDDENNNSNNM